MGIYRPSRRFQMIRYAVLFVLFTTFGVTALFEHAWPAATFFLVFGPVCGLLFLHDLPRRSKVTARADAAVDDENHRVEI